jgi:hypothetical protein
MKDYKKLYFDMFLNERLSKKNIIRTITNDYKLYYDIYTIEYKIYSIDNKYKNKDIKKITRPDIDPYGEEDWSVD